VHGANPPNRSNAWAVASIAADAQAAAKGQSFRTGWTTEDIGL
jgi:hypothetical protein